MIIKTDGKVSEAEINGETILATIACTLIFKNIVIDATKRSTIAVGVKASNERATDAGTCGGIDNLKPLLLVNLKISTAKNAESIPINIPPDPRFAIGRWKPEGTAAK